MNQLVKNKRKAKHYRLLVVFIIAGLVFNVLNVHAVQTVAMKKEASLELRRGKSDKQ